MDSDCKAAEQDKAATQVEVQVLQAQLAEEPYCPMDWDYLSEVPKMAETARCFARSFVEGEL